jgi:hypothetical protein
MFKQRHVKGIIEMHYVEGGNLQIIICILCYNNLVNALNQNIKKRKGLK